MPDASLKPWQVLASDLVFDASPWIQISRQRVRLPDGRTVDDYHQIVLADYVVIAALTADNRMIMERMYKHGIGRVCLMLPAGAIDAGESPLDAARRELLEETGYAADRWQFLGEFVCQANYGCGTAHIYVAHGAHRVAKPDSGDLEEMEIVSLDPDQVVAAVAVGQQVHQRAPRGDQAIVHTAFEVDR